MGGFPCQPFSVQENKKVQTMTAISGREMRRLIRRSNPNSLLGRMQGIINLQNGMVLRQCKTNWKVKVSSPMFPYSTRHRCLHQRYRVYQYSQHNGLLAAEKPQGRKDYGGSQKGQNETIEPKRKVDPETMKMYPTPSAQEAGEKIVETLTSKDGSPLKPNERAYNPKTGKHVQMTLNRAVKMYPTPTQDSASERTKKYKQGG